MKRLISICLAVCLSTGILSGCTNTPKESPPQPTGDKLPVTIPEKDPNYIERDISQYIKDLAYEKGFDESLITYINSTDMGTDNYIISPLSFKIALSLLAEGANDEINAKLFKLFGVKDLPELRLLNGKYIEKSKEIIKQYTKDQEIIREMIGESENSENTPASSLIIGNSVWKNRNYPGELTENYIKSVEAWYDGAAKCVNSNEIMENINTWVNDKTNGMIPQVVKESVSEMDIVLVNAIYLRDAWLNEFNESETTVDKFTTVDNEQVDKEFMHQNNILGFYKDEETKILIMPTKYGFNVIYVLGDTENIDKKLENIEYKTVTVKIPKIDIESSFENSELINFLKELGINEIFNDSADFSRMSTSPVKVSDIIQKAKIKTDEKGIEGAAVTAIAMDNGLYIPSDSTEEFIANEPFSFYVRLDDESVKENIFYGQVVR